VPSSIAHAAVAVIANPLLERGDRSPALLWLAAGAAAAPDLDAVGWVLAGGHGGLPVAHRGVTHSLAVATVAAAVLVVLWHRGWIRATRHSSRSRPLRSPERAFLYFAVVIASHGLLDWLTTYGDGVALLAPFSQQRFSAPWLPFDGLTSEVLCLWLPALVFLSFNVGGFRSRPGVTPKVNSAPS
jgi:inner membrane protein